VVEGFSVKSVGFRTGFRYFHCTPLSTYFIYLLGSVVSTAELRPELNASDKVVLTLIRVDVAKCGKIVIGQVMYGAGL